MTIEPKDALNKVYGAVRKQEKTNYAADEICVLVGSDILEALDDPDEHSRGVMTYRERLPYDVSYMGGLPDDGVVVLLNTDREQYSGGVSEDFFDERFRPRMESVRTNGARKYSLTVEFDASSVEREWLEKAKEAQIGTYSQEPRKVHEDHLDRIPVTFTCHWMPGPRESHAYLHRQDDVAQEFMDRINEYTNGTVTLSVYGKKQVQKAPDQREEIKRDLADRPAEYDVELVDMVVAKDTYDLGHVCIPARNQELIDRMKMEQGEA